MRLWSNLRITQKLNIIVIICKINSNFSPKAKHKCEESAHKFSLKGHKILKCHLWAEGTIK